MSEFPVPKNPIDSAIEKSIEEAAAMARDYVDKLVAPGLESSGELIADQINYWRFKNRIRLVLNAKAYLESKGVDPSCPW
jgi:hypothetical protein